jgi:hypothetical protein
MRGSKVHDLNAVRARQLVGNGSGPIRRVVVHDDQLGVELLVRICAEHRDHELRQTVALVVRRDDDREVGRLVEA